jgi:tetratricopeptide (TPR) repeat protein
MANLRNGLCLALLLLAWQTPARAQQDMNFPPTGYYLGFSAFHAGDYRDALGIFQASLRSGVRSTEGRWVDAICYHTMIGECFYQMGDVAKALEQYDMAVKLAVVHNNWMLRVQFPDTIEPSASAVRSTITWGATKRPTALARIPDRMGTVQGQSDAANIQAIQGGGVVATTQIFPLNVKEVVRCTAVAIRRRQELMGSVCRHDPLTGQLLAALGSRPTQPNHWSQAWISCQLGLAYKSAGKLEQAASELTRSLVVAGQFDHELTALALVELGHLAFDQGQYNLAADFYLEATFAAAVFDQFDVFSEAFQGGWLTHLISGKPGLYTPLVPATAWVQRHSRAAQASLLLTTAENYVSGGEAVQAAALLGQARQTIGNREMRNGRIGGRFNYLSALVDFQQGNLASGTKALATAMTFQRLSSKWLMQIGLADRSYVAGGISQRVAEGLYSELLREPTPADWAADPAETLVYVSTPRLAPLLRWFDLAILLKDDEKAIEIADRLRRHRFHSTLPLGGRTLALRWILEAPQDLLSQSAVLQRQDLMIRYPEYAKLAAQAVEVRQQLRAIPLETDDAGQRQQQKTLFTQLAKMSDRQELILSNIALRREPSEFVFPPLLGLKQIQAKMPEGQLLLAYVVGNRNVTAFAVDKERIASWQVESPEDLPNQVTSLLRSIGVSDRKKTLEIADFKNTAWQKDSARLLAQLTNIRDEETWSRYREVVIVPDGYLWYVPFETLYTSEGAQGRPLISKLPLRYVPTAALANAAGPVAGPQAVTGIVAGRMFPGLDLRIAAAAADDIRTALPSAQRLTVAPVVPSSLLAANLDRLVVLHELDQPSRTPYGWSPMQLDRGVRGTELESWLTLPWQGPAQIVLPGYRTAADTELKSGANGDDIFLPVCGLMASGAGNILLSRWLVGGQSSFDLIREYVQELPYTRASEAWRRSVLLGARNPIDPALEPKIRAVPLTEELRGAHPFFWATYLLIDTGVEPRAAAP